MGYIVESTMSFKTGTFAECMKTQEVVHGLERKDSFRSSKKSSFYSFLSEKMTRSMSEVGNAVDVEREPNMLILSEGKF